MPARSIEQVRNLCKRRGFVFPGSAAYGGLGSFWDYGPLGTEMLNNVKRAWWRDVVYKRDDVEGLDAAILMSRKVWQHSGHEATFSDPLVDNKKTGKRYRLDHLLRAQNQAVLTSIIAQVRAIVGDYLDHLLGSLRYEIARNDPSLGFEYELLAHASGPGAELVTLLPTVSLSRAGMELLADFCAREVLDLSDEYRIAVLATAQVVDPAVDEPGAWTAPRHFNLMFESHVGPVESEPGTEEELASRVYLRPETAQGIFMNFAHVQRSMARKVPFGIAQIGKAFRNEITPGNFIFRTREFEQMEIEFFIKPPQFVREGEKNDAQWHDEWIKQRYEWWTGLGIDSARLRQREQSADELAHYSKRTVDLEYLFPEFGWGEVEGIANRTDYDLTAHSRDIPAEDLARLKLEPNTDSVEKFDYFDPDVKARYIPWVIEPSAGATRAMLAFLCEAYHEELTKDPPAAEVDAIKAEIPAVIKNAQKKQKDAEKESDPAQRKHDPAAIEAFCAALEEAATRLPQSLLEIDALLAEHPGAQNLEPVKKLQPKVNKLAEDCARVVLKLHPALAPIKLAVFPLKKNKPELVDIARRIAQTYQPHFRTVYDDSAGIGRLYRRQDEIGTPWCVTVDFQTLEDNTVTVRERDSMQQQRINLEQLRDHFFTRLHV
ncbi:MAG: glycine--tRNA ligase [Planctomycetes bacterium]|nr:glycine--tRNA ligase [Planctomycetota bacterium]MCW8135779.1 glycine--tRNA ligase [Planctomycetota bacterium]